MKKPITIYAETERKEHNCRIQKIKDISISGKQTIIVLKKRRYKCPHCNKRFYEKNSFLPKHYRSLIAFIIDKLRDERSFTSVAEEVDLSVSTVIRIFDLVFYSKAEIATALSIDEFKGNTQ